MLYLALKSRQMRRASLGLFRELSKDYFAVIEGSWLFFIFSKTFRLSITF